MQKLFDHYKRHAADRGADESIVRSFIPIADAVAGQNVLLFRLNSMNSNEKVVRAEMHLTVGPEIRSTKWKKRGLMDVRASCASCLPKSLMLPVERFSTSSKHWLSYDLTYLVDDLVRENGTSLRVQFPLRRQALDRLVRMHSPFLLIFTERVVSRDREITGNSVDNSESEEEASSRDRIRGKRSLPSDYHVYGTVSNVGEERKRDSNYLHDDHGARNHLEDLRNKGPRMLHGRRKKTRKQPRYDPTDPMMLFGREPYHIDEPTEEPYLTSKQPDMSDYLEVYLLGRERIVEQACAKHELVVDFRDIGWDEWIIAPKSFDAHYCAGTCSYPLQSNVQPSNHAILQSAIRSAGINSDVPDVCCAPGKMDSLTLLYYDEMGNVVLKNFPKMTVTSCGCI